MRKKILSETLPTIQPGEEPWLDLETLAEVEVTSEDPAAPIESALLPGADSGWLASGPGEQTITLRFDEPQTIRRIRVHFVESRISRTQEFTLRWWRDGHEQPTEIVRQQYNFSPPHTTEELEEYHVSLDAVRALELRIRPEISGGAARASLASLRLA